MHMRARARGRARYPAAGTIKYAVQPYSTLHAWVRVDGSTCVGHRGQGAGSAHVSLALDYNGSRVSVRGSCEKSSADRRHVAEICIEIRASGARGANLLYNVYVRGGEQLNDAKRMLQDMMQIAT